MPTFNLALASGWRFTKRTIGQARIQIGFNRFTEIGWIFHNKYIFNNKKAFQVEIWNVGLALPHIHYIMETDLDEMIRRFARLHERDWPISRNQGKETLGRPGLESIKIPGGARVSAILFSPTILDAFYSFYNKVCLSPGGGGVTLGISGWGCAAGTLEPLTRASSAEFCYPILE